MGVAGAGKTTIGRLVADELNARFVDADDLHSPEAVAAMRTGHPLDDAQRRPWLHRVNEALREDNDRSVVVACSALKRAYRDVLRDGVPGLVFVYLDVPVEVLTSRLQARTGHYAYVELLPSQLTTLELGDDVITVDGAAPPARVVQEILRHLGVEAAR